MVFDRTIANDLQKENKSKREPLKWRRYSIKTYFDDNGCDVLGVVPLITATGAGAVSRFNIGLVLASGISIGTYLLYLLSQRCICF